MRVPAGGSRCRAWSRLTSCRTFCSHGRRWRRGSLAWQVGGAIAIKVFLLIEGGDPLGESIELRFLCICHFADGRPMAEPARAYWGGGKRMVGFEGGRDGQDGCIIYRHLLTGRIPLPRIRLTWGPAGYEVDRLCARTSSIWTDKGRLSFASVKFIGDVENRNSHVHDSPVLGDSGSCRGDQRATKKMGRTAHSQAFLRGVFAPSSSRRPLRASREVW